MTSTSAPTPLPEPTNANEDRLAIVLGMLNGLLVTGTGAPAHTPVGPQLYLRTDGGAGTTLYVYEPTPAAWNPLA